MAAKKTDYYSYTRIDKINATYNIIIGQRSNGKTFGICRKIIDAYIDNQLPSAYIRRLEEQIKPTYIETLFNPHAEYIAERTQGKYNAIVYRSHKFYMARFDELQDGSYKKMAQDKKAFCTTYAVNTAETSKGADNGEVMYIVFDEFITRAYYLPREFVLYQNLLSSIIRDRKTAKIYMLANTVSKHCPYFRDMGLTRIREQQQGTIDVYNVGKTTTKIAVEYCAETGAIKKINKYFAFDNPELEMITRGSWEIALYRHAPPQLSDYKIIHTFFVVFDGKTVQGDIYIYKKYPIIFYHPKTTPIQKPDKTIIYYQDHFDGNPLHQIDLRIRPTRAHEIIYELMHQRKTFYSDNETGEIIAAWLKFAMMQKIVI